MTQSKEEREKKERKKKRETEKKHKKERRRQEKKQKGKSGKKRTREREKEKQKKERITERERDKKESKRGKREREGSVPEVARVRWRRTAEAAVRSQTPPRATAIFYLSLSNALSLVCYCLSVPLSFFPPSGKLEKNQGRPNLDCRMFLDYVVACQ